MAKIFASVAVSSTVLRRLHMEISPFCLAFENDDARHLLDGDNRYFHDALMQALFAMGMTHPNPAVGAVLVRDGEKISVGHTHAPGGMHAEKHALAKVKGRAEGATLYVTLEPCAHFGRTPPCTNAIIDAGITRVVYGAIDPNPAVCGHGLAELKRAGIAVEVIADGRLRSFASAMLKPFTSWVNAKRPYVVVKIATSFDGFFARSDGERSKISGPEVDAIVHAMRRASDAILVGGNTVRIDDPLLTARLGPVGHGKQPVAVVVSAQAELPLTRKLFNRLDASVIVAMPHAASQEIKRSLMAQNIGLITVDRGPFGLDLAQIFKALGERGFTLVLVEAGPKLFTQLVTQKVADEVVWCRSDVQFNCDGPGIAKLDELVRGSFQLAWQAKRDGDTLMIFSRR